MNGKSQYYFEDLVENMAASIERHITEVDIVRFGELTGDLNPLHFDEDFARKTIFGGRVAHGMLTASLFGAILGTKMPGPGCIFLQQSVSFRLPVRPGDTAIATVKIKSLDAKRRTALLDCSCNVREQVVAVGEALAMVPARG